MRLQLFREFNEFFEEFTEDRIRDIFQDWVDTGECYIDSLRKMENFIPLPDGNRLNCWSIMVSGTFDIEEVKQRIKNMGLTVIDNQDEESFKIMYMGMIYKES